ncbi:MAG TPA: AI-2E family transporter YdiK [Planctomycetota bacterium]|nr:AI-2E family transporter YdiK [Planctomycetota bacterium]
MNAAARHDVPRIVLVLALLGGLILLSLWLIRPFLPAIVWATMITVATWPIMVGLQRRLGGQRWAAVTVMTIAQLLVFVVPLSLAIGTIVTHVDDITGWARSLETMDLGAPPDWLHKVPLAGERLDQGWRDLAADGNLRGRITPYAGELVKWFVAQMGGLGTIVGQFLLTVIVSGILFAQGEAAARGLLLFAHRLGDDRGEASVRLAGQAIRGVALGVVVTALVQSVLGGIGLAVVGMPFVGVLTAVMFMLAVAQIGVIPVLACAVIYEYMHAGSAWGTALLVWSVFVGLIDNFIRPVLIKRGADLPLLLIFAGVVGGLISFGLVGIFVGPVVLAVTWTLVSAWVRPAPEVVAEAEAVALEPETDTKPPPA